MNDDIAALEKNGYTLEYLDNRLPWEKTLIINLINERIQKTNNELKKQLQAHPAYKDM